MRVRKEQADGAHRSSNTRAAGCPMDLGALQAEVVLTLVLRLTPAEPEAIERAIVDAIDAVMEVA